MAFTEAQLKAGVGMALRNRDAALNDAVTLSVELEGARAEIETLKARIAELEEQCATGTGEQPASS